MAVVTLHLNEVSISNILMLFHWSTRIQGLESYSGVDV